MPPQKVKKTPQKDAYLWQLGAFFLCSPDCPKQPRTLYQLYKFVYTIVSAKVSANHTVTSGYHSIPSLMDQKVHDYLEKVIKVIKIKKIKIIYPWQRTTWCKHGAFSIVVPFLWQLLGLLIFWPRHHKTCYTWSEQKIHSLQSGKIQWQ